MKYPLFLLVLSSFFVEDYTNLEQVKLAIKEARFLVDKEKG